MVVEEPFVVRVLVTLNANSSTLKFSLVQLDSAPLVVKGINSSQSSHKYHVFHFCFEMAFYFHPELSVV